MSFSFGQPAAAPAAPASGGLFGSQPQQPAQASTFGGFGAAPKPAFSFGSPAPAAPQAQPSSLFGSTSNPPAPSTSLFGQPQPQPPSSSLFGAPPPQQQPPPSSGLFGAQPQQPQQQQGGLFGSTSQQPQQQTSFGFQPQNQPQQQQQQQQQPPLGISQLGGAPSSFNPAGPAGPVKLEDLSIEQRIEYVKGAWDPSSPTCKFQYFFYNLVPPNETHLYGRPQNARDDAAWFKAQRENPDPSTMVPALAIGFDDIRKRTEAQMKMAGAHWNKLQEISTRLSTLSQSSSLSLTLRLSRSSLLQTQLSHRTLLLIRHLHLLIPTLRSSSIRREEEQLLLRLEALVSELQGGGMGGGGGGGGSVKGRMMELWALVGQVRGERERDRLAGREGSGEGGGGGKEGWAVVDEEAMERLAAIISDQQTALAHLTKVLKEDLAAIEIMRQGLGLSAGSTKEQQ